MEKCFYPDNRALHVSEFTEFLDCINPNESISLFSARLSRIFDRLKAIDDDLSERYLCFQLLRYLPQEFDNLVQLL